MASQYAVRAHAREAALSRYGLAKTAGVLGTLGSVARNVAIGDPVGTWEQFQGLRRAHGALGAYGRMLKDYHWAPRQPGQWAVTPWIFRGLGLAQTGNDFYQAVAGDPGSRMANLAGATAGALVGPATGSLGVLGSMYAHGAIVDAARRAGHLLDKKPEAEVEGATLRPHRYNPAPSALTHANYITHGITGVDPGDLP